MTQDERVIEEFPDVVRVASENKPGLSLDPNLIHQGQNGGYQAINLAVHFGAKRIILIGYDMKGKHWHPDHKGNNPGNFAQWIKNFSTMIPQLKELGVEVINCTRDTALECFSVRRLEDVL